MRCTRCERCRWSGVRVVAPNALKKMTFPNSTEPRYATTKTTSTRKKPSGSGAKPSVGPMEDPGSRAPMATTTIIETSSGLEGRLRKKGTRLVRMTNTTRVWVASDSTNQPDRNRAGPASKTHSITAKVAKSKIELIGPTRTMNRRMNPISQCEGRASCSSSTLSVGIVIWLAS